MADKNIDVTFLLDVYERYLSGAKKAEEAGNIEAAKKNYYLAADTLYKVCAKTTGKLKDARINKVKALMDYADKLTELKKAPTNSSSNESNNGDEDGKKWEACEIPNVKFSDIIGLEDVKQEIIMKMINPVKHPEKYKLYKKKTGGGIILYGPPGTGKTMIAKAIANEVGAHFYAIKSSDIISKWVGDSERNIASLFETANKQDKAIIFIDEMDSLFKQRGDDAHNDKRVNEFLQQIDGFTSKNENLLVLGASNRPWDIDNAAMRSGRFSEKIYIHLPQLNARKAFLQMYLKDIPLSSDVDFDECARLTEGFSGADMNEVAEKAKEFPLRHAIETNENLPVTQANLIAAIKHVAKNIDNSMISTYEKYANRNNNFVPTTKNETPVEPKKEVPTKPVESLVVKFAETEFTYSKDKKYTLEFYVNKEFEKLYLQIDSKNLVCTSKIFNWTSSSFTVEEEGTYEAIITDKNNNVIGKQKITFTSGLEEVDMGV